MTVRAARPVPAFQRTGPRARFRDLIAAEWIKLWSLRSTGWTLGVTALVVIGSAVLEAKSAYDHYTGAPADRGLVIRLAFPSFGYLTLMLVAISVGGLAVVGEYGSGLARTTAVAVPARGSVVLAKAVVMAVVWTVAGTIMSTVAFLTSQSILDERGISFGYPGAFSALLGASLLAPVCALTGLGVLVRHAAATIGGGVVGLVLLPSLFSPTQPWSAALNHAMILAAWQRLTENYGPPQAGGYPYASLIESWIVYAVWPLVTITLALIVVRRRDV
ncbi:ABC transporter permease [Amycolatopsis mediterranei]|uniref:ABC transporter permease n=1 Tax=Amycolatopsis mediterranei TaxID=33910 RepID=UPI00342EE176